MNIEISYNGGDKYEAHVPPEAYANIAACLVDDDTVIVTADKEDRE